MANDKAASAFMGLPLEVRHTIFEYVAAREVKPKKLLRYWFEKKEVKALVEQEVTNNPNGPAPQVVYGNDYDEYEDESAATDEDGDESDDPEETESAEEDSETEDEDEDEDEDGDDNEEAEQEEDSEGEDETELEEGDEGFTDSDSNTAATVAATQPLPPAPVVRPHAKWRHIPNFMRLTQCPAPVQLLLVSQQLNNEAKNWFYDVATLRIDATGSFAHTSFFEEAFSQITDAAFSPMENIRKVDITFVWDSTWIRADTTGSVEAIFPALLRQRSKFVHQILLQAPDLREVTIHWQVNSTHDSAQDDESTNLMLDNLEPFHTLPATVKVVEHYIVADATPRKRSVAGKRRVEFQNILDMGLDRLF
ncbi:unnamed protein product [Alternaria alternata]